jgi:hypothetical protein
MIFHVDGQALDRGIEGWAVRQRPGFQNAVHFQPQVIVETSCAMSLNKKAVSFPLGSLGGWLGSAGKDPLLPVFF